MKSSKRNILETFRQKYYSQPFDWKENNCVNFSLSLVQALYDVDLSDVPNYKGFASEKEYFKFLKKEKSFLSDLVTKKFGKPLQCPALAKEGDIVIEGEGLIQNMGVCYKTGIAYFPKKYGLVAINTKQCTYAWRVNNG